MDGTECSFKGCECLESPDMIERGIFANRSHAIYRIMLTLGEEASE